MRGVTALVLLIAACAYASREFVEVHGNRCEFTELEECVAGRDDWVLQQRADKDAFHRIVIAVRKPENAEAQCSNALMKVSDPESPNYGQYYSLEDLQELDLFSEKSSKKVAKWLKKHDIEYDVTVNGDWYVVEGSVEQIEQLIGAEFYEFHSATAGKTIRRTAKYALPKKVSKHVDFIGNTLTFPPVKMTILTPQVDAQSGGSIVPQDLYSYYKIPNVPVVNPGATQSLFEALGQSFAPADLQTFQTQYNVLQNPIEKVIGPNDPSQCTSNPDNCGEANLDVQYIMAIAQNATTWFWSIDPNSQDPFLDWVLELGNTTNPPLVHSVSYGSIATENPTNDMYRFNTEICQMGLRGLTVVVASGDDGVANFEARNNASACGFNPSFPTTSPYVTGVGATQGTENNQPEIACASNTGGLITTGGGFSIFFNQPAYQSAVVNAYLSNTANNVPPTSMFNANGRGYPDVAMAGHNYNVVIGGSTYQVSGTSAAAPVFAGVVTLINNARLNNNLPPLGFLNPTIYSLGATTTGVFNDITSGENNCCAGQPGQQVCCQYGFTAAKGWDPLTGFGSVNYPAFLQAMMKK